MLNALKFQIFLINKLNVFNNCKIFKYNFNAKSF
jgi:hypothetical protein